MTRWLMIGALAAVFTLFVYALTRERTIASPLIGGSAPGFDVPLYAADSTVSLAGLAGRPVVLNFWASWCLACRDEAAVLERGWRRYGPEVAFVGLAVNDEPGPARAFIDRFGKTYVLGADVDGSVAIDYGLHGVPETFFIAPDGRVLARHVGPLTDATLAERVAELKRGELGAATGDPAAQAPLPGGS